MGLSFACLLVAINNGDGARGVDGNGKAEGGLQVWRCLIGRREVLGGKAGGKWHLRVLVRGVGLCGDGGGIYA